MGKKNCLDLGLGEYRTQFFAAIKTMNAGLRGLRRVFQFDQFHNEMNRTSDNLNSFGVVKPTILMMLKYAANIHPSKVLLMLAWMIVYGMSKGQYPFEKYPAIDCQEYKNWTTYNKLEKENKLHHTITIPRFFNTIDSLTTQLTLFDTLDYSIVRLFKNKQQIQKITLPDAFYGITDPLPLYMADFNSDSLMDIKLLIPSYGSGGINYYARVIYLLQKPDGTFNKISYTDLFEEFKNRLERDVDGDGVFEVITQTFQRYQSHNYWLFDLYAIKDGSFENVNFKDNYPIMVQLLFRQNFAVTNNITREKMKDFERKLPIDYSK